jgi:acetylornithine deacetylase/succinyl-diaminopimelate desuccinylase-like protein
MAEINWNALTTETVRNLVRLIQAETVNPPGNELPAILVIKDILDCEGFPQATSPTEQGYLIVESAPGRANLVARLRGDGSTRPLLLSGHVDVVPVEPEHWTHNPFGGEVIDDVVWGRGAVDMKGDVAKYLEVFLLAYRHKLPLKRDLILAAIADEEDGFDHGSKFLIEQRRELIDAEYGLTESGGMTVHMMGTRVYPIQVAEKGVCWLRATTRGRPGHGSMPHDENAVLRLAQALERLRRAGRLPIHLTPPARAMLDTLARHLSFPYGILIGLLRNPALTGLLLRLLPAEQRNLFTALLSNSVSATMLQAGSKVNVIPSKAEAQLDCRLLPGQRPEDAMREIQKVMGEEIELQPFMTTESTNFSTDTPLYRLMETAIQRMDPGGAVMPTLLPGATDASQYARAGIQIYGFTPGILPEGFSVTRLAHGHDERLPISAIRSGLPALWDVVSEFCSM